MSANNHICLGTGGFGKVYKVASNSHSAIARKLFTSKLYRKRERDILDGLAHTNIVKMLGSGDLERSDSLAMIDNAIFYIDLEFIDGVTIHELTRSRRKRVEYLHDPDFLVHCLRGGLEALAYLHDIPISHRDIKPANIMVTKQKLVLIDLGVAIKDPPDRSIVYSGSLGYQPPEFWATGGFNCKQGDIYAYGASLYELVVLDKLVAPTSHAAALVEMICDSATTALDRNKFHADLLSEMNQLFEETHPDIAPPADADIKFPAEFLGMIGRMTARNPNVRPTAEQLLASFPLPHQPGMHQKCENLRKELVQKQTDNDHLVKIKMEIQQSADKDRKEVDKLKLELAEKQLELDNMSKKLIELNLAAEKDRIVFSEEKKKLEGEMVVCTGILDQKKAELEDLNKRHTNLLLHDRQLSRDAKTALDKHRDELKLLQQKVDDAGLSGVISSNTLQDTEQRLVAKSQALDALEVQKRALQDDYDKQLVETFNLGEKLDEAKKTCNELRNAAVPFNQETSRRLAEIEKTYEAQTWKVRALEAEAKLNIELPIASLSAEHSSSQDLYLPSTSLKRPLDQLGEGELPGADPQYTVFKRVRQASAEASPNWFRAPELPAANANLPSTSRRAIVHLRYGSSTSSYSPLSDKLVSIPPDQVHNIHHKTANFPAPREWWRTLDWAIQITMHNISNMDLTREQAPDDVLSVHSNKDGQYIGYFSCWIHDAVSAGQAIYSGLHKRIFATATRRADKLYDKYAHLNG